MKGRRRVSLAKAARKVTLIALVGLCLTIVVFFLSRWQGRPQISVADRAIPPQKVESQEKVRHFVYKGEKWTLELSGERYFVGEDGLFHFAGGVEIVQYGVKERPPIRIQGDEAAHDKDLLRIRIKGKVSVLYEETTIHASQLDYSKEGEILRTDKGVAFETPKGKGSAQRMSYLFNEDRLLFKDKVVFDANPEATGSPALHLEGDSFEYLRRSKHGIVRGNVILRKGRSHAEAGRMLFDLTREEDRFRSLTFEEGVTADIVKEGGATERSIRADRLLARFFSDGDEVRSLEAKGDCLAVLSLPSGNPAEIKAPELKASFNKEGGLKKLSAKGKVEVTERATGTSGERVISGDTLAVNGKKEVMIFAPDKGKKGTSRMVSVQAELEAGKITFKYGKGDFKAEGAVKGILQPGSGGKVPTGLFAGQEPVFVSAGLMRYAKDAKRSIYKEEARIWQGKQTVQADLIQVFEDKGSLEGRGKVKTQFWHKPKDAQKEERVEISADMIDFNPEERRVLFRKTCQLKARDASLEAETVTMDLAEGSSDMTMIVAKGSVIIRQGAWEGRGGRAEFAVPEETVVLLENPVLIDKDKGETQGDKLTFHLADGRILIENRRRDRSVTVIKS